jgi:hypothetical protein
MWDDVKTSYVEIASRLVTVTHSLFFFKSQILNQIKVKQ